MFTYEQAKAFVIEHLEKDAEHHDAGRFSEIGEYFDELDINLPRSAGDEFEKLHIALIFWDSWQDARNHEWQYYPKIEKADWPRFARIIVADLLADREVEDQLIVQQFGQKK